MLDELRSKSGHRILRCEGKLLASREDPIKEATRWLTGNQARFLDRETVLVLGVGCGYHLELLAQQESVKNIIGLESSAEVLIWTQNRLNGIKKIKLYNLAASNIAFSAANYSVLKYFPSWSMNPQSYQQSFEFYLGRSESGAKYLLQKRQDLKSMRLRENIRDAVNYKDIITDPGSDAAIWKALGELVS